MPLEECQKQKVKSKEDQTLTK